jgi:hypothetical protein
VETGQINTMSAKNVHGEKRLTKQKIILKQTFKN